MKRAKRRVVGVLVLTLLMSMCFTASAFAAEKFTIHAKVPAQWSTPGLWAWSAPDGTNVFSAWPGEKLVADAANDGWFSYELPVWTNSIIINEGIDGGGQTSDVSIEAKELWITVADDFSTTLSYEAPSGFAAATEAAPADMPKTGVASTAGVWLGAAALSCIGALAVMRRGHIKRTV